jgi:hypothetical protein
MKVAPSNLCHTVSPTEVLANSLMELLHLHPWGAQKPVIGPVIIGPKVRTSLSRAV